MAGQGSRGRGPGASDNRAPGGSRGTGGYGNIQDRQQGRDEQGIDSEAAQRDRGEAFDEAQGGGRDDNSVSQPGWNDPQDEAGEFADAEAEQEPES